MNHYDFYLSGPMTGLPLFNRHAFDDAEASLAARGHRVCNPAKQVDQADPSTPWEVYLRADLRLLLDCRAVVVLPGWRSSRGSQLEVYVAQQLGMEILEYPSLKPASETVCQEADRLVSHDRQGTYGHPWEDFTRTGRIWAAILGLKEVTPEQVALCMVGVKISRECHAPKRDNRTDGAGYFKCLDMVAVKRAEIDRDGAA